MTFHLLAGVGIGDVAPGKRGLDWRQHAGRHERRQIVEQPRVAGQAIDVQDPVAASPGRALLEPLPHRHALAGESLQCDGPAGVGYWYLHDFVEPGYGVGVVGQRGCVGHRRTQRELESVHIIHRQLPPGAAVLEGEYLHLEEGELGPQADDTHWRAPSVE